MRRFRSEILAEWKLVARAIPAAHALSSLTLVDHVPELLDELGDVADALAVDEHAKRPFEAAARHALDRLEAGFEIATVVSELSLLRGCILKIWARENAAGDLAELCALNLALDRAIEVSVAHYAQARERIRAKLESMLAASPVGMAFVDRELRYQRINDALAALNGTPAADHIGRTVTEVLGDAAADLIPILQRILETGEPVTVPFDHRSGRSLLANYFAVRSATGDVIGVGGLVVDVTEQKRAQDALHAEQARLDAILQHSPAAIWVKDPQGRIVVANERLAEALGVPLDALINHRSDEVLPPGVAEPHQLHDEIVMRENRTLVVEETAPGTDGVRTFLSIKFPIPSDPPLVGAIATEITDRKRMEDALREAVKTREEMVAVVSHDLRTPLSAVQLSIAMLEGLELTDHRVRRHLETIHRSSRRMQTLIEDLLDTAEIGAGRLTIETRSEPVASVVKEAIDLHQPLAAEKGIQLLGKGELDGVTVMCDRDRILQVLSNLIGNAIKFCRPGDTITVTGEREDDHVRLSVVDTGPGVSPDVVPYLFDAYWSGAGHARSGSGLGLYICRGIIEGHGGRIWVDPTPGHGATFVFTLPETARAR